MNVHKRKERKEKKEKKKLGKKRIEWDKNAKKDEGVGAGVCEGAQMTMLSAEQVHSVSESGRSGGDEHPFPQQTKKKKKDNRKKRLIGAELCGCE